MPQAVIAGIGETRIGTVPELSDIGMCVHAAAAAVEDAGIRMQDVDGLLVQPPFHAVPRYHILVAESLGIYAKTLCDSTMMGGRSGGTGIAPAATVQVANKHFSEVRMFNPRSPRRWH